MKNLLIALIAIFIASVAVADLCGPWSTITDFYDRDLGIDGGTIRVWDCYGLHWLTVSDSTSCAGAYAFLGYNGSGDETYETCDSSFIFIVDVNGACTVVEN